MMFPAKLKIAMAMAAVIVSCGTGATSLDAQPAGPKPTQANKEERTGPLAGLPSRPEAHLEKIKKLGDNEWVDLGAPKPDPKWGRALGRSYGSKALVLAPNLRGAFFAGEGRHGFVKPDGYGMDDFWFYDIHAHQWICLYPGTDTNTFTPKVKNGDLKIDELGLLRDKSGQVVPVHTLTHSWSFLAYDSDRNRFAFLGNDGLDKMYMPGWERVEEGVNILNGQMKSMGKLAFDAFRYRTEPGYSLWCYDPATGKFQRAPATGSWGQAGRSFPQLHYLAGSQQFVVAGRGGVAFFDPTHNRWTEANAKGPISKSYEPSGCLDSKRNRIYSSDGDAEGPTRLLAYDIKAEIWTDLQPQGTPPETAGTNRAYYEYDARLDLIIVIQYAGSTPGVYAYNPQSNSWSKPLPLPDRLPKRTFSCNTCYDPELNAYFCFSASDSGDDGSMWAYRFKARDKGKSVTNGGK